MGHNDQLPQFYVRVDVAHNIKIFCRNNHLKGIKNKQLKQFYIRGLRLLITSYKVEEFNEILIALLTTMMSETNGFDEDEDDTSADKCKKKIIQLIKCLALNDLDEIEDPAICQTDTYESVRRRG